MLDDFYKLICKVRALRRCDEDYNLLINCVRKLYFLIAYLVIPYGNMNTVKLLKLHLSRHAAHYFSLPFKVLSSFEADKNSSV